MRLTEAQMAHAYVTEPGAALKMRGRMVVIEKDGRVLARWGLARLESVVLCGNVHLTTPVMRALLHRRIPVSFISRSGRLYGQLVPPTKGDAPLRLTQYQVFADDALRLVLARTTVVAKIYAMGRLLDAYCSNYSVVGAVEARRTFKDSIDAAHGAHSVAQLLGFEGRAGATWWRLFRELNRSGLIFDGRNRRPPKDPINTLLSVGYTLLEAEIHAALECTGFDPYVGFYHELKAGRPSLALDLMEPYRHEIIDRLVLRLVNLKQIRQHEFEASDGGGLRLTATAWKTVLTAYERQMLRPAQPTSENRALTTTEVSWRARIRQSCSTLRSELLANNRCEEADKSNVSSGWEDVA